jgi:glutamine amidotransferase
MSKITWVVSMVLKVAILDYSIGNIYSVKNAFKYIGANPVLVSNPQEIKRVDRLVLPGVGAFNQCISTLENLKFIDPILEFIKTGRPLLGICVGMQLLMSKSLEGGESRGLDIISGVVEPIPALVGGKRLKVPHIGWRCIEEVPQSRLLENIAPKETFYFVHSYNAKIQDSSAKSWMVSYENYPITALVEKNNVFGCQFHPEKSRESGLTLLNNFMML